MSQNFLQYFVISHTCNSVKTKLKWDYNNAVVAAENGGHIMEIRFLIEKDQRKALAHKVAELTGEEVYYLGVPSCAYQIGAFILSKDAVLDCGDEDTETLLGKLEKFGYEYEPPADTLTLTMPREFFTEQTLTNLRQIVENKSSLIRHALGTDSLDIVETDENIEFPWFTITSPEDSPAYCKFIAALCDFAKSRKRVNYKPDISDNEKYAFRCFLLRLGMIGREFKATRQVLLRNLTGNSAFRNAQNVEVYDSET